MKKEEIITASIMILIIVLEIFIQCYTKKSIEKLTSNLKELKEMTLEAQKNQENETEENAKQNKEKDDEETSNENSGENMEKDEETNSKNKSEGNKENDIKKDKKNSELREKSQEIFNEWLKNFNVMAYFIEHDELEKVNTQMRLIMAEYEANSIEDAVPEIEEGIFILEHIEDRQEITWKNIF